MLRWTLIVASLLVHGIALAASAPSTYGQSLLEGAARATPGFLSATIVATPPKASSAVVAASTNRARVGAKADPADVATATSATPSVAGMGTTVRLPLTDVSGDAIGVLVLTYATDDRAKASAAAERTRDWLHRRVSHAGNLFDPYPYEPDAPLNAYAQRLADEFLERYPEIEIFAIHATPPGSDYNVIAGSNIGRIGKKADNDDMRCVYTGKPNLEVNSTGKRFETEMQLHDKAGTVIGAVGIVVAYKPGADKEALHARAEKIRAELEAKIPDAASLFKPAH